MADRIWVISELYYPEDSGTGYFLTVLAESMAASREVHVICGQPNNWLRGVRAPRREQRHGVNIRRCRGTTLNKDRLPLRLINLFTITFSMFFAALLHIRRGDLVLVVTNPPTLPFPIVVAARLKRARCVLRIEDVYPEVLYAAGLMRPNSFLSRTANWMTRRLYRAADRVVVLGRDMEDLVARRLGSHNGNLVRITNWADVENVRPGCRLQNALLQQLGLTNKFVVQYSGTIGRIHGIEDILEAASQLGNSNIHFLFIGSGAKKPLVEQAASTLRNVTVLPVRPREELSISLNACDVAIVSLISGMTGVSVPSRMYNILAAGKPIIAVAEPDSELARLVLEERVGWVVPTTDRHKLADVILQAASGQESLATMGTRARGVAEKYSKENIIAMYQQMLSAI
jgi:glycosyltransferase involved in cell wall biosynthesis